MLLPPLLLLLATTCDGRLRLLTTGPSELLTREGEEARLECATTTPWFLCVWTGPRDLALHLGEGDRQETHGQGARISSRNGNKACRLHIPEVRRSEAGVYRCVLTDREAEENVDREFELEVGHAVQGVQFLQGPRLQFYPGQDVELSCMADGGHPAPALDIYSRKNISFESLPQTRGSLGGQVVKEVRFVAQEVDNNTEVSCRAEQRDRDGVLIYSTLSTVLLELLPPGAAPMAGFQCVGEMAEWWCGYELLLYLLLVLLLLALSTCCFFCFCCLRRRREKRIKDSPEVSECKVPSPRPGGILKRTWEPTFFPPPLANSPRAKKPAFPSVNIQSSSPEPEKMVLLKPCLDAENTFQQEKLQEARPPSQPSTIGNFYSDDEHDRTLEEEIAQRRGLLTEYEETIMFNRMTQMTTIEERLQRINMNSQMSHVSDTSSLEDEVKRYQAHQYSLKDCADVRSRDLSYSQVVKEHLSHNPSLDVSTQDITFTVPAPLTKTKYTESTTASRTASPLPPYTTLPTTARHPAHKPTTIALPSIALTPATPVRAKHDDVFRHVIEKHLGRSQELLAGYDDSPRARHQVDPIQPGHRCIQIEEKQSKSFSRTVVEHLGKSQQPLPGATSTPKVSAQVDLDRSKSEDENKSNSFSQIVAHHLSKSQELLTSLKNATKSQEHLTGPDKTQGGRNDDNIEKLDSENGSNEEDSDGCEEKNKIAEEENVNFSNIIEKHLGLSRDSLNGPGYALRRQVSLDGSCFTAENDFDIVDPDCNLTMDDVKKTFIGLRDQGQKVDKETFVKTMMDFFPKYNKEQNRIKLGNLFDRLDKNNENLISFRQFMLVTICFSSVSLEDKLTRIFKLIDENENGELTYEEFEEVVHDILVLKEERKMSASQVEARFTANTFRHMGMNSDGNVILRDFVEACTQQKFILINYIENFRDGFQSS